MSAAGVDSLRVQENNLRRAQWAVKYYSRGGRSFADLRNDAQMRQWFRLRRIRKWLQRELRRVVRIEAARKQREHRNFLKRCEPRSQGW